MSDFWTVVWKERKGLLQQRGSRSRAIFALLIPALMLAIFLPWQIGRDWLDTPWSLVTAIFLPVMIVGMTIPESFAGERERHTLSTLLASRLSDHVILYGKLFVAIVYGWSVALIALAVSLMVVNLSHWDGQVMLYTPTMILANLSLGLLMACLVAILGVLISLRSSTVQGATQFLMVIIMLPVILLQIAGAIILGSDLGWLDNLRDTFGGIDALHVVLIVSLVLVAVNLGLLKVVMARFQRARLILD